MSAGLVNPTKPREVVEPGMGIEGLVLGELEALGKAILIESSPKLTMLMMMVEVLVF